MAVSNARPSIFCIASYEKGQSFLREAARLGAEVILLTVDRLRDADWPRDVLAEFHTMPADMTAIQVKDTVLYLARTRRIDRLVPLDEFDVEIAALIREEMRLDGLGQTITRLFRDKLAMRTEARKKGILVPDFCGVIHYEDLRHFMAQVPGPWLLKPRAAASAIGIKPIGKAEELWPILDALGDEQSCYLLEQFVRGEVFHLEGVTWNNKLLCGIPCKYGKPPMQTMHQGGVFTTRTLAPQSEEGAALVAVHEQLMARFGLPCGVTHTEFIRSAADGKFYFLETAARVGGAYIADMVEFATGMNPWVEWARMEVALASGGGYALPALRAGFAGSVISLARQETPDLSAYTAPEIVLRMHKPFHAGLIVASDSADMVQKTVERYADQFLQDFCAVLAPPDRPNADT
jgi:biotin carboxylase